MTDSIKVCCRFRKDKEDEELDDWEFDAGIKQIKLRDKKFNFDEVLDMNTSQEEMYEKVAFKTIEDFTNGYHGTIFAYGNSGSGKTFSIVGPDEIVDFLAKDFSQVPSDIQKLYGVIPRATISIFQAISEATAAGANATLIATYIEIYNESITCLLNQKENLKIHEIPKQGFSISGKEERVCMTPEDIFKVIYIGSKNKTIGGTNQNARSSRSHTLLTLELRIKTVDGSERMSKLNIVDLAGSEKLKNTGVTTPERMKEAQKINQSLTTLGMCIMALTENASFVPFRNSKLTLLLKESLGGNSKTTLLCAARRDKKLADDNLNSLYFAQRAKSIKTKSVKNVKISDKEYEYIIQAFKNEVISMRKQVKDVGFPLKPITDPKLLQFIDSSDLLDDENAHVSGGDLSKRKRQSLINLTEDEIILKYCELRAKYDNLMESASNKILDLTSQVESNSPEINGKGYEALIKQHEIETGELKKDIDHIKRTLEMRIENLEKEKKKLLNEANDLKSDMEGLQDMLNLNQIDIEGINNQLFEKEDELSKKLIEKDDLINKLKSKDLELATLNKFYEELKQEKILVDARISEADKEIQRLSSVVRNQEMTLTKYENEILGLKQSKEAIEAKHNALFEEHTSSKLRLEQDNQDLRNKIQALEQQLKFKDETISSLNKQAEEFKNIQQQNLSDKAIYEQKDKLLEETKQLMQQRINQLEETNIQLSKSSTEAQSKLSEDLVKINQENDVQRQTINDLTLQIKHLNEEASNAKAIFEESLSNKDKEITTYTHEIERLKSLNFETEKKYQSQIVSLEESNTSKTTCILELENKINSNSKESEKIIKGKDAEVEKLLKDKSSLAEELELASKSKQSLDQTITSLEERVTNLRKDISTLQVSNRELIEVTNIINKTRKTHK